MEYVSFDIGESVRVAFAELIKEGMWKTMSGVVRNGYLITAVQDVDSNDVYVLIDFERYMKHFTPDGYEHYSMVLWDRLTKSTYIGEA